MQYQQAVAIDPLTIFQQRSSRMHVLSICASTRERSAASRRLSISSRHTRKCICCPGRSYLGARRLDEVVKVLERGTGLPAVDIRMRGILGCAYAIMGRHADAQRLLDEIDAGSKPRYPSLGLFSATFVHVGLGQHDQALDGLERLCAERSTLLHWTKVDPL